MRAVKVTGRTKDRVWRRIAFGARQDGWVFATSLDFVTERALYATTATEGMITLANPAAPSRPGSSSILKKKSKTAATASTTTTTASAAGHFRLRQFPKWSAQTTVQVEPSHRLVPRAVKGEWVNVETPLGRTGWLPRAMLA